MKVFKFGGGSVRDAEGVKQLERILNRYPDGNLVVVISAIGKTTNHLENIVDAYYKNDHRLNSLIEELEMFHVNITQELLGEQNPVISKLAPLFAALKEKLSVPSGGEFDYDYDQIVSFGELLSSTLVSSYLNYKGVKNQWVDARSVISTDNTYREGKVDWSLTTPRIQNKINELGEGNRVMITQGFIGGTSDGYTTTLGREGSDYSAAIFAYASEAEDITIWKDVPGFFNADPKKFPQAVKLEHIPYEEAIELSYYGATIIHPKTLKPLQNKQIPLYVKSFFDPDEKGSVISADQLGEPTPSYIFKTDQILISIFPKDFSFIAVDNLSEIFSVLSRHRLKINLMQNSALTFSICVDNVPQRIEKAISELELNYKIKYNNAVELVTIRHYTDDSVEQVLEGREVLIEQKNRTTIQLVLKEDV